MPSTNFPNGITGDLTGNASKVRLSTAVASADGAITVASSHVAITKGTAAALTLAMPAAADDGTMITITAETAAAHVVTAALGFNDKGSAGTATFGGAKGDSMIIVARNQKWWALAVRNVVFA
jgi:hypothetical protein